ncbi:gamma-interferon-inducible lysosomal thiol reductase-like protein [Leptinotarsa decemlineata]|uniref:gamma-interferon-inducible lysosomal thiol reductase-like protein n=1 Tax=Leptinotarsa decemlineata TaxID=7539 RepID=UPI003D306A01
MWRFVLAFSVLCISQNYASTVTISVYYESLCPDSVKFFKEQLGITHDSFEGKVEVDLIPFGNANFTKEDGNYTFTCQHGELECHGNKVHSCALKLGTGSNGTQFVMCAMNSSDASDDKNLKKCASEHNIEWESIQECVNSEEGDEWLAEYGNRTYSVKPKISFIPTIIFNNIYKEPLQNIALKNLHDITEYLLDDSRCDKNGGLKLYSTSLLAVSVLISIVKMF